MFKDIISFIELSKQTDWLKKTISLLELTNIDQIQIEKDLKKRGEIELIDNIQSRKKIVIANILEYYDSDTRNDILKKIKLKMHINKISIIQRTKKN